MNTKAGHTGTSETRLDPLPEYGGRTRRLTSLDPNCREDVNRARLFMNLPGERGCRGAARPLRGTNQISPRAWNVWIPWLIESIIKALLPLQPNICNMAPPVASIKISFLVFIKSLQSDIEECAECDVACA